MGVAFESFLGFAIIGPLEKNSTGAGGPPILDATGPMDRFLIVNADDFGRSEFVNAGIAEAFRQGILTSASIVANGAAFEAAVALLPQLEGLGVGIHLVLNEHEPVLPPSEIPSLVTKEGRFPSRGRQLLNMAGDPRTSDDAFKEWDAQISKVLARGIKLDHIDGHGHCHAHPRVAGALVKLAERYAIRRVRLPVEPMSWRPERVSARRLAEKLALNSAALCSRRLWSGRLTYPQPFYGFSEGGRLTTSVVRRVAQSAPPGVSELMTHLGVSNIQPAGLKTRCDWEGDLRVISAFRKADFEKQFDVKLITFAQLGV